MVRNTLWVATLVVALVLLTANVFGSWPEEIDSGNYSGSMTQVYTDIMKPQAVLQGAVSDTNVSATADIDCSKLKDSTFTTDKMVYGIPYMPAEPGDSSKKYAYGNAKIVQASNRIPDDSTFMIEIDWSDSSEVGNPAFAATPRFINVNYYAALDTLYEDEGAYSLDIRALNTAPSFIILKATASLCTVRVYNAGSDTLWTKHGRLLWEAME